MTGLYCTRISAQVRTIEDDLVIVHFKPENARVAKSLLTPLSAKIEAFQREIGIYPGAKAPYYIAPTYQEYFDITSKLSKTLQKSDAFYSSETGFIVIRSPEQINDNYLKILMHEYIHWYLDQLFMDAPLWFHEGMATYFAGQLGFERHWQFIRYRFWGKQIPLLTNEYPASRQDLDFFYLNSTFALRYMKDEYPQIWKEFWDFVASYHRQGDKAIFRHAFRQTFNSKLYTFNESFEAYARRLSYWYIFIGINSFLITLMPFLLIIAWLRRRSKMRQLPDIEHVMDDESELDSRSGSGMTEELDSRSGSGMTEDVVSDVDSKPDLKSNP